MRRYILLGCMFVLVIVSSVMLLGAAQSTPSGNAVNTPPPDGPPGGQGSGGFSNIPNGIISQSQFNSDLAFFDQIFKVPDGLGPIYNAQSCRECHQNPVTGAASQVTEQRFGHTDASGNFVAPTVQVRDNNGATFSISGRSLINDRAICAPAQERVDESTETIHTFRISLNVLGDGFIEVIPDQDILNLVSTEPTEPAGGGLIQPKALMVGTTESHDNLSVGEKKRVGRFGWKSQMSSLLSFASNAFRNEMGMTSRLAPNNVEVVAACDTVADPEDSPNKQPGSQGIDVQAEFMRATQVPPTDTNPPDSAAVQDGSGLFNQIGCAICHQKQFNTAPAGTVIAGLGVNGTGYTVPTALGGLTIEPYSDFLLHNLGTGDGVVDTGDLGDITVTDGTSIQTTANYLRTPPLWGVRVRSRLMHDGESVTFNDAIQRHAGEATAVKNAFNGLTNTQKSHVIAFLKSL
ncbi:MAG TPA: di-heme oxidoredictase family protein [Candidatus Angelobacter sp.]